MDKEKIDRWVRELREQRKEELREEKADRLLLETEGPEFEEYFVKKYVYKYGTK